MSISVLKSGLLKDMFGTAAMRVVFDDAATVRCYVDSEVALARVQGRLGVIPGAAAQAIEAWRGYVHERVLVLHRLPEKAMKRCICGYGDHCRSQPRVARSAYLMAVGGAAYLVSRSFNAAWVVAFEDFGMEAIYEFEVYDMPMTVAVNSPGHCAHDLRIVQAARA